MKRGLARRVVAASVLALALGAGSWAHGQTTGARPNEKVVLQLSYCPQFQFAGYYAALDRGYYAAEGLDVEIRPSSVPVPAPLESVLAGDADFGTCESDIVLARAQGKPVVLLAPIFQHSACCVLALPSSRIATPADLVGRRIALTRGHRDAEVLAMLLHEGIAADKLVTVGDRWDIEDLIAGKIDARLSYVTNEPDQLRRRGIEPTVMQPVSYGIDFYGDCLFTTEAQVRDHPERTAAFRRASLRGWEEAFEHTDEVVELLYSKHGSKEVGLSREHLRAEADTIRRLVDPKLIEIGHVNRGRWRRIADTYGELGLSRADASIEGLLYDPHAAAPLPAWLRGILLALAASLVAGGGALFWVRHLGRLVERRTRELSESEERFRRAFESAVLGGAITDLDGRITRVNPSLCDLLGYRADELLGRRFSDFTHPDDVSSSEALADSVRAGAVQGRSLEKRYMAKDGRAIWVLVSIAVVRDQSGKPVYVIGQIHDLTQRRAAEEALRESEKRFRSMADGAPVMISLSKPDGSPEYFSQRWLTFTGRRLEDEAGGWVEGVHPLDRARCVEEHRAAFEARRPFESLYRLRRADGEWRWVLEHGLPRVLADGSFAGFVSSAVDVSERHLLEEQLRQSQKMEAIGQLAGGVAHDFNNILAVVAGYTDLLLSGIPRGDQRRGHVEQISSAVEHASALTRQLLALSRKQFLSPTVLDLNAVLSEMQLLLRRVIGEHVELATVLAPGVGRVKADHAQLEQVVLNLVVNARDAMPRGGRLTLETLALEVNAAAPRPPLEPGRWIGLVVRDTGTGMDEKTLARIFEPFFTTKERGKGTGLGLSTVYAIVTQSGGRVDVTSEPGRGSAFHVFLPEAPEPIATVPPPAPAVPPRGTETILLVEDDAHVRSTTEAMLRSLGYRVLSAKDGEATLEMLSTLEEPVHLVLTDVVMPRLSGPELAARLRETPKAPRVLFMSGYLDERSVPQGGLPAGSPFLAKPFGLLDLSRRVRETLDSTAAEPLPAQAPS